MTSAKFRLDTGDGEVDIGSIDELAPAIEGVADGSLEFAIVNGEGGSYTQIAGAHDQIVAEWRDVRGDDDFNHYKVTLPRPGGEQRMPLREHATEGYRRDELMSVTEARELLRQFMARGRVESPYVLIDISDWS